MKQTIDIISNRWYTISIYKDTFDIYSISWCVMDKPKACCGFGHREVFENISDKVYIAVHNVAALGCRVFYTGAMGEFDDIFSSAVCKAKNENTDIRLVCIKPYLTKDIIAKTDFINYMYDDIVVPTELADVHYKSVITKRNRIMIDKSDIIMIYNIRDYGGAYQALKYAESKNKTIIRINN